MEGGGGGRTFNSGSGRVVRRVVKRRGNRLFVLLANSPRCKSWCFPCPFGWKSFNYVSRSFATVLVVLSFTGGGGAHIGVTRREDTFSARFHFVKLIKKTVMI